MLSYSWPGNVRELISEIKRLSIMVDKYSITENDLKEEIVEQPAISIYKNENSELLTIKELENIQKSSKLF